MVVEDMAADNVITNDYMYRELVFPLSRQTIRLGRIKQLTNINQLVALTDHCSEAVRYYAFKALADTQSDTVFLVLLRHLRDTVRVISHHGCMYGKDFVGDRFIQKLMAKQVPQCGLSTQRRPIAVRG